MTCAGDTQQHLTQRIANAHDLAGRVTMTAPSATRRQRVAELFTRYRNPVILLQHLEGRRWQRRQEKLHQPLHDALFVDNVSKRQIPPDVPHIHVHDVNSAQCVSFVEHLRPDAIVVNGTNLLRDPWFKIPSPRHGILNIHTGLSPYCRGGNCNLFAILQGQLQAVGVTVHYIDRGIDSGDIVFTDRPRISAEDSFASLEKKNFKLGEDLMIVALEHASNSTIARHKQWTEGRLFLKRTGYVFQPYLTKVADHCLREEGLIERYLHTQEHYDESVRVIRPTENSSRWRHPLT